MSRLKNKFHKRELFLFGGAKNKIAKYADIFTCLIGTLPLKCLGMLVDEKKN